MVILNCITSIDRYHCNIMDYNFFPEAEFRLIQYLFAMCAYCCRLSLVGCTITLKMGLKSAKLCERAKTIILVWLNFFNEMKKKC